TPTSLSLPVSPILTPSTSAEEPSTEFPPYNEAGRKVSQSGSEAWSDIEEGLSALPTEITPTDKRESQQTNVQRVPFKVTKTGRRSSTEAMLTKRHGPRKVPDDVSRSKKSILRDTTPSQLSEATGVSERSSGSDRTLRQESFPPMETEQSEKPPQDHVRQQAPPGGPGQQWAPISPESLEGHERPIQPYQHVPQAHWFGPPTPESAGRPPLWRGDGSASLPSPQSLRSGYGSPGIPETPSSRPTTSTLPNASWSGQQGEESWNRAAGQPVPPQIRSGVSLFQQPQSMTAQRQGPLPQSPRSKVRLEDQVEALRDHIASQQRPVGPNYGGPVPGSGPYWQQRQMYPGSPQVQRASFSHDSGQGLRQMRPPQAGIPSPAPTASSFPDLQKTTLEGYELLAAKLTDGSTGARPMYRSFERLHHRLLLYLQDEICEYEEELRNLDEWISQVGQATSDGKSRQASRRAEARLTPADSELMFRRKFVLGEIFVKLERYHRALEHYRNASKDLQRPQEAEIARYRQWMETHRPVEMAEAAFLKHEKDLFVLPRKKVEVSAVSATTASLPLMLLLPFIAFAVMPNFLCRILAIFACSMGQWALCSVMDVRHILTAREWLFAAGIYVAFMTLVAAVAH
ncbi:hypothetical protein D6D15_09906, partial [Aureobasidium pullulans]